MKFRVVTHFRGAVLSGGLLLVGRPAKGYSPRPVEEPAGAPSVSETRAQATGTAIAKKAKAAKKAADKKADKEQADPGAGGGGGDGKQKPFPSKAEAIKDIDDISKK